MHRASSTRSHRRTSAAGTLRTWSLKDRTIARRCSRSRRWGCVDGAWTRLRHDHAPRGGSGSCRSGWSGRRDRSLRSSRSWSLRLLSSRRCHSRRGRGRCCHSGSCWGGRCRCALSLNRRCRRRRSGRGCRNCGNGRLRRSCHDGRRSGRGARTDTPLRLGRRRSSGRCRWCSWARYHWARGRSARNCGCRRGRRYDISGLTRLRNDLPRPRSNGRWRSRGSGCCDNSR